jgi:ornithine cyclodeaminase
MQTHKEILFLSVEQVLECGGADIVQAAADVQKGFQLFLDNQILQPYKTTLRAIGSQDDTTHGIINFLPAYLRYEDQEIYGCKAIGAMPDNVRLGLPRATGLITLFDAQTKLPVCIMDAQVISATRTGAVSLLAARVLAQPDIEEVGLVGAGVNMKTQLLALTKVLPNLKKVLVHARGQSRFDFAKQMAHKLGLEILPVDTIQAAVENKKMVVACRSIIARPLIEEKYVCKEGVTFFNIGGDEVELKLMRCMNRIVADHWNHAKHRGVQPHVLAVKKKIIKESQVEDLLPIMCNRQTGRRDDKENIFFSPSGLGFEDVLIAWRVYHNAINSNVGQKILLWESPQWI